MRGLDVSRGWLPPLLLGRREATSGGAACRVGAQVEGQLRSCLQAEGSEASVAGGQRFLERREAITHAPLRLGERKAGAWSGGGGGSPGAVPRGLPSLQARGKPQPPPPHWSSPSLSLSLSPCPPFASCLLWFQSRLQNTKLLLTFILQAVHHS